MRLVRFAPLALLMVMPLHHSAQDAAKAAYETDPKFVSALTEAQQMKRKSDFGYAIDAYKKAAKISGGQCKRCLDELYALQFRTGQFKDSVNTANQLLALAQNPREKSKAEADIGTSMLRQAGDKPKPAQLETIHTTLQAALTDFPKNLNALWSDACVMARLGKTEEASKEFAACAQIAGPADSMHRRAEHFAENPALSMNKMAPAFEVTALDGTKFNLDDMNGRVVLIDFWATWCGPCNEELPHLKKIAKEFEGQPLVMISVSWDNDEAKWKDFIAKHEMTWVQYRDKGNQLSEMFGIHSIPHYFTIDSDGVLTAEMVGSGSDVEGKLKKLLKRAREAKPATLAQGTK